MTDETRERSLDEELHALAEPLRARLKRAEQELAVALSVVEGLRENRDKVKKALRAVDPTFEPYTGKKPGPKSAGRNGMPDPHTWSEDAVAQAIAALEQNRAEVPDEFTGTGLGREKWWPFSSSYTTVLLRVLNERGVVRMTRRGTGGSRLYSVV